MYFPVCVKIRFCLIDLTNCIYSLLEVKSCEFLFQYHCLQTQAWLSKMSKLSQHLQLLTLEAPIKISINSFSSQCCTETRMQKLPMITSLVRCIFAQLCHVFITILFQVRLGQVFSVPFHALQRHCLKNNTSMLKVTLLETNRLAR